MLPAHDILRGRFPDLLTILVPRHVERGSEIEMLCGARPSSRRSTGGIIGALVESGESKENAALYAEALRRGGAIVTAKVPDDEAAKYKTILSEKSFDVTTREVAWRESGWAGYDPAAPAYDAEQVRKERESYRL